MSWTDMMTPWETRRHPGLPLGNYITPGFCADCAEDPETPCPDHEGLTP